jgi:FkbM family methyltransferase
MKFLIKLIKLLRIASCHQNPVKYIFARLLVKTGFCEILYINRDNYKLHFFKTNVSVSMWLSGRDYYCNEEALIRQILKIGDNFIDVGANIGHLSIVGKKCVKNGRVIAIEAHPVTSNYAKKNFNLNKIDIEMLNFAVGNKSGVVSFSNLFADDCNSVIEDIEGNSVLIKIKTLDELLFDLNEIKLLKIDVEGYELMVLQGATETLKKTHYIYFEVWDKLTFKYKYSPRQLLEYLQSFKFNIYRVKTLNKFQLILPSDDDFSRIENLLAIKSNYNI